MKTVKKIFTVLLMLTVVALITSCGKDPQIYGKWKVTTLTATDGVQSETISLGLLFSDDLTFEFKKDGQFVMAMGDEEHLGEFTLDGDHLVLKDMYSETILDPNGNTENYYDILGSIKTLTKTDMSIELSLSDEVFEEIEEKPFSVIVDFERLD